MTARKTETMPDDAAIWQQVEFGGYHADLATWEKLAADCDGPVLELGAGAGRVALHLAERGHDVLAVDGDAELADALEQYIDERTEPLDGSISIIAADLERPEPLKLPNQPALAIAPLHLIQIVAPGSRPTLLSRLAELLQPSGRLALTLVNEETLVSAEEAPPGDKGKLPEMRDLEGWIYSSEPLWVEVGDDALRIRRLRQMVDPDGGHERALHDELLHRLSAEQVEREAAAAGFTVTDREAIRSGPNEADSLLLVMEAPR